MSADRVNLLILRFCGFACCNISHLHCFAGGFPLRKVVQTAVFFLLAFFSLSAAHAQQIDAAFGGGTVTAPSASGASGNHSAQSLGGGAFLGFSGDFVFKNNVGFQAEVAWRASQNSTLRVSPGIGLTPVSAPVLLRFGYSYELQGAGHAIARLFHRGSDGR